jgi:hypothetical protein
LHLSIIPPAFGLVVSAALCLATLAELFRAWRARSDRRVLAWRGFTVAGVVLGCLISADPLVVGALPAEAQVTPIGVALSLAIAIGASIWTFATLVRSEGALCVFGAGGVLGVGIATSSAALIVGSRSDLGFDDTAFFASVALASALASAGFAALKLLPARYAASAATACVAIAIVGAEALTRASLQLPTLPAGAPLPVATFAAAAAIVLLAALRLTAPTTAPAWRGSRRPSPAPSPAGTRFLRPARARSAAGPAASLGRPAPPAR